MDIKVEIIAKETVKPAYPTPNHHKTFQMSLIDQLSPPVYTGTVLFYNTVGKNTFEISQTLKKSLSQTLSRFYPLAGRIRSNINVECNDGGVNYVDAQVNCLLSDFLKTPKIEVLNDFLPAKILSKEAVTGCLFLVQANFFKCGGLAIGLCISHKITDGITLSTFIKSWAGTALDPEHSMSQPKFIASAIFPPTDSLITMPGAETMSQQNCVTRRFVFDDSKIAQLKAKAMSVSVQQPTRVEAVNAIIWKCAQKASRLNSGITMPSVMDQAMNLRKRVSPPLPEDTFGNLVGSIAISCNKKGTTEPELQDLVSEMRKERQEFCDKFQKKLLADEGSFLFLDFSMKAMNNLKNNEIEVYRSTSWCGFALYETDFGWGKPTWVSSINVGLRNLIVLMDTKEGAGIEAWLCLSEDDMARFESDRELCSYAVANPSLSI